jgi:hypothetical protein
LEKRQFIIFDNYITCSYNATIKLDKVLINAMRFLSFVCRTFILLGKKKKNELKFKLIK